MQCPEGKWQVSLPAYYQADTGAVQLGNTMYKWKLGPWEHCFSQLNIEVVQNVATGVEPIFCCCCTSTTDISHAQWREL